MTDKKEGARPCESALQTDTPNNTAERPLYLPLAWAELASEAKANHKSRATEINAKRYQGAIAAELAGLIALALVSGVLLLGGA